MKKISSYMKKVFIYLIVVAIGLFTLLNLNVFAAVAAIELVWTEPGEDASTELIVSWSSSAQTGVLYWTEDSDTTFSKAQAINATGVYNSTAYAYEQLKYYTFEVTVSNLTPNTTYRYRIKAAGSYSNAYTCKTAGTAGNFGFLWIGDFHTYKIDSCATRYSYLNNFKTALDNAGDDLSFIISTGDNVSYGGSFNNYQVMNTQIKMFKDAVFAPVPGNHDYYGNHDEFGTSKNVDNRFYESMFAHPNNGIGNSLDSSYWYIYNSILFIALDSLSAGYNGALGDQKIWFKNVVEANEGKFQYLFVYQHYPWMNALTGEHSGPYTSNYNVWHELFDEYGVDIAIGGDHHVYYRSKAVYQDQILEDTSKGTVYIGCPQIGDRYRTITERKDEEYYAIRIDDIDSDPNKLTNYSGVTYFNVTPQGITGKLIDTAGNVKDTYTVSSKRSVNWDTKKETIKDELIFSSNGTTGYIDFNPTYSEYLSTVKVMNNNETVTSVKISDNLSTITLNNLETNKVYNYKLVFYFVDGTSSSCDFTFNTYGDFGTFDSFKATPQGEKLVLSWNQELKNDVVKSYEVYQDGNKLTTLNTTSTSYEITKSTTTLNSTYTIKALASNGDVIFTKSINYSVFGDANYDGVVNSSDVSYLFKEIQASYKFTTNELTILDLNQDGKVNVADALLIYELSKNEISSINNRTYTVTILNKDGSVASRQIVAYGQDANLPTISDSNFLYYTSNGKYVTSNMVIRAVYSN